MSRLWLTGYRSYELGIFGSQDPKLLVIKDTLKKLLANKVENGTDWLITGGQLGVEQWSAEVGLDLKKDYPELKIAIMTPFAEFGSNWNETNRSLYAQLASRVDFHQSVSEQPYHGPQQLRNYQEFMLTHTDEAVMVYDLEHEGKPQYDYRAIQRFEERHAYPLTLIDMDWLQESANEYQENLNNGSQIE
ncbi:MAG: DUF1273 domain-containing protein [Levilactobacillus sp.]|jgi:uncharacterized phage-like protein YoqJ|uniref:DUF1273 domain-containing protein n=1 Tax=Levilactobacillus sp. TaxID=2767919 RepID=UPI00258EAECB|nr:DUF1273 domain-containing protein [Levilactobacillus sp.]MCH4123396.1 DUF1273 domain-containing protein [Levilactobacillus sp.]MCI1552466.1 DUF1273 domain-containing protein [Levilactobacillus sp.]